MGRIEESVRRASRVLAAYMSQDEAATFGATFAVDPTAFQAAWQTRARAQATLPAGYSPPRIEAMLGSAESHIRQLLRHPAFANSKDFEFKRIELGRLISFQNWIDVEVSAEVHGAGRAQTPEEDEVLRKCLPLEVIPPAAVKWMQTANSVTVCSLSNSLRFFGPGIDQATGHVTFAVGNEPNLMLVREYAGRYVLANGYHRAWWLRSRGIEMAPVFVVHHGSADLAAQGGAIRKELLFGDRPPLVDYFADEQLAATIDVRSLVKVIKFTAEVSLIPRLL